MPSRPPPPPGKRPALLKDPCNDRPVRDVPLPPAHHLPADVYWTPKGHPDLELLTEHLRLEGLLAQDLLLDIVKKATDLFEAEPNLIKLSDPITLVGDVHGQYYDLLKLFEVGGDASETQYIFLGDYVDRGSYSCEILCLLYSIKIRYPKKVRMLRGNHECRQMTSFFNFREECEYKYDIAVYNAFMESFDTMPLAATINGKFLAVHGGLSPELPNLKAITSVNRFQEPPREGLLCDLLWSDPLEPKEGEELPKAKKGPTFVPNEVRGCSYYFSFEGTMKFLTKNNLLSVIRAHEAQLEGYKMHRTSPATGFPSVITIFSAPNYCDCYNNKGAILKFEKGTLNILQYNAAPHPYHLPNFTDVFTWSMPFVIEKVTEMLYYVLQPAAGKVEEEELPSLPQKVSSDVRKSLSGEQADVVRLAAHLANASLGNSNHSASQFQPQQQLSKEETRERMRQKVRTIARMARMFKTLRQENETIVRLKGVCPGHRLAPGLLLAGRERLQSELDVFTHAVGVDKTNESRPEDPHSPRLSRPFQDFIEA